MTLQLGTGRGASREPRFDGVDKRLSRIESNPQRLIWMVGVNLALTVAIVGKLDPFKSQEFSNKRNTP
jgi:hypothetical protein